MLEEQKIDSFHRTSILSILEHPKLTKYENFIAMGCLMHSNPLTLAN